MSLGTKKVESGNTEVNVGFPYPNNDRLTAHVPWI